MKNLLLDASAFMLLIKKMGSDSASRCLQESAILDLTFYEVGNALWKESALAKMLSPQDAEELTETAQVILARMEKLTGRVDVFGEILGLARTERLPFYDSSYLFFAKENKLTLVTEDKELYNKAKKHIHVQKTADFIKT
jgi:predicted nucleic acid-binding protein